MLRVQAWQLWSAQKGHMQTSPEAQKGMQWHRQLHAVQTAVPALDTWAPPALCSTPTWYITSTKLLMGEVECWSQL